MADVLTTAVALEQRALRTWGLDAQRLMVCEEAAELVEAVAKHARGRATDAEVLDEAADAIVVAAAAAAIAGKTAADLRQAVRAKLDRLAGRLGRPLDHFGDVVGPCGQLCSEDGGCRACGGRR